ncbi:MAG: 16S rRNA (guanine(527)-N(7))-methyltransferase RsmG [Dehalococcoidia bacterium]|nr:16S rRNA (guanine(527)-N(7))-methyltransferase RsmG [Dehalococcoidia bacterium]
MQSLIDGTTALSVRLSSAQLEQFQTYYDDLIEWNRQINLTSITDYQEAQLKHFVDSLSVVLALPQPIPDAWRFIDVGTGGGFPGIPLKIAFPQIKLTLLEATGKKCDFLRHLVRHLNLVDVDVLCARSEDAAQMTEYREQFDVVLTRGLAKMAVLSELTLPFCKMGGMLIAQKKVSLDDELQSAANAISVLGGQVTRMIPVTIAGLNEPRCLVVVSKSGNTLAQYPRRNGVPAKNPLLSC